MKISTILDHIDSGHMALLEIQLGHVWNWDQMRGLFDALFSLFTDGDAFRRDVVTEVPGGDCHA